jgi:hypothetical protein
MFIKINKCPFCGSIKSKRIMNKKLIKNFYVEAIISELNISLKFLEKNLERRECKSCFSIYFSKWFNNFIKKKIFLTIYGQHNMGWQNFYNFKNKLLTPNHGNLFIDLKNKIKFKKYGEYGCPFNGLFFDLLKEELKEKDIKRYINVNLKNLSNKVRNFNQKKIIKKRELKAPKAKQIYKKYFLIDSSNLIWGKNDISENCSSLGLADKIFNFNLYNSDEKEFYKNKFDLFSFFMTLDHCESSHKILIKILTISKFVLIHGHVNQNLTAQHSFTFTKKIKNFLTRKKIYNIDLTNTIIKDPKRNKGLNYKTNEIYLLCSKSPINLKF